MTAGSNTVANRIMGIGLQGLFVLFPASCASVAVYDIWLKGMASPILIVALGIAGIFFAAKLVALGFTFTDAVLEAARPLMAAARRGWGTAIERLASALAFHDRKLSQA
jgi:hypothetical protein